MPHYHNLPLKTMVAIQSCRNICHYCQSGMKSNMRNCIMGTNMVPSRRCLSAAYQPHFDFGLPTLTTACRASREGKDCDRGSWVNRQGQAGFAAGDTMTFKGNHTFGNAPCNAGGSREHPPALFAAAVIFLRQRRRLLWRLHDGNGHVSMALPACSPAAAVQRAALRNKL